MIEIQITKNTRLRSTQGFTLLELVISISVFMLFMGLATGTFIELVKANKTAQQASRVYRETRFLLDTFGSAVHNGTLDYGCIDLSNLDLPCLENQEGGPKRVFAVRTNDGKQRTVYRFNRDTHAIEALNQTRSDSNTFSNDHDWQMLTTEKFPLEDASFDFFPMKNPYASSNATDDQVQWQPTLTIKLKLTIDTYGNEREIKTTYTSRHYGK